MEIKLKEEEETLFVDVKNGKTFRLGIDVYIKLHTLVSHQCGSGLTLHSNCVHLGTGQVCHISNNDKVKVIDGYFQEV